MKREEQKTRKQQEEQKSEENIYLPFKAQGVVNIGLFVAVKHIVEDISLLEKLQSLFTERQSRLILDIAMYLLTRDRCDVNIECVPPWRLDHATFSEPVPIDPKTGEETEEFFDDDDIVGLRGISVYDIRRFKGLR